jgi:MFS family permease
MLAPSMASVEDVFERIGQFGRAQQKYFFMIGFVTFLLSYQYFMTTYTDYSPAWDCVDSTDHYHHFSNRCATYERGLCFAEYSNPLSTIVSEWDLICHNTRYARLPQRYFFIGCIASVFLMGLLGNFVGRKILLQVCIGILSLSGLFCVASIGIHWYIILRFIMGVFTQAAVLSAQVWMCELTGPTYGNSLQAYNGLFTVAAATTIPPLAAIFKDWRLIILIVSLSTGLPLFYLSWVPESPGWLLVNQRESDAETVFQQIASENNVVLSENLDLKHLEVNDTRQRGLLLLLSYPRTVLHTLILMFCWFSLCLTYFGVTYTLGDNMGGNRTVNFILSFIFEIPATFSSVYIANMHGRRFAISRLLIFGGCFLVCSLLVSNTLQSTSPILSLASRIGFAVLGKVAMGGALSVAFFFTSEVLPTEVK